MKQRVGAKITNMVSDAERAELLKHPRGMYAKNTGLTNGGGSGTIRVEEWLESHKPLTASQAVPALRKESEKWQDLLTDEEKRSITKYTKNSGDSSDNKFYQRLNAMLRGDAPNDPTLQYYADTISSALNKSRLSHSVICYRTVEASMMKGYSVGGVYFPKQFLSTAVTPNGALKKGYRMMILAGEGANGAYIETLSKYPKQRELLFNLNCKYRILEINSDSAVMEVII